MIGIAGSNDLRDLGGLDSELFRQLRHRRLTPEILRERGACFVERKTVFLQRARHPHIPSTIPEMLTHLPHHRGNREGEKVFALGQIETVHRTDQTDAGRLDEIVERLSAAAIPQGDMASQR